MSAFVFGFFKKEHSSVSDIVRVKLIFFLWHNYITFLLIVLDKLQINHYKRQLLGQGSLQLNGG
jgi:hypothetical protein